jgi:hypothetical protein
MTVKLAALIAALSAGLCLAQTDPVSAQAQAFMESATYGGAGNVVVVSRIPVRNSTGQIAYKDVKVPFSVSAAGVLTAGTPVITASPVLLTGDFVAGRYRNGSEFYMLSGPGVGSNGRTTWSVSGLACTFDAGWTTGPVVGHPSQARLQKVAITYGGLAYGSGGGNGGCFSTSFWAQGSLVAASGGVNGFTLFTHTKNGTDSGSSLQALSFTRCLTTAC